MRIDLFAPSRARTEIAAAARRWSGREVDVTGRRNAPGDAGPLEARDSQAAGPRAMKRREAPFRGGKVDQGGFMRLTAGGGLAARDTENAGTASNAAGGGLQQ